MTRNLFVQFGFPKSTERRLYKYVVRASCNQSQGKDRKKRLLISLVRNSINLALNINIPLILLPSCPTLRTLVERCHRLISAPNLHHVEERLVTSTILRRALRFSPIDIIPRPRPTHHILSLLPLHHPPLIVPLIEHELVRTRFALQPVDARRVLVFVRRARYC